MRPKHSKLCSSQGDGHTAWPTANCSKGIIWDVDGTLIDSEPLHFEALLAITKQCGCPVDECVSETLLGASLADVWGHLHREHTPAIPKSVWMQRIVDYYLSHVATSTARPGVISRIQRLWQCGVPLASVSTAERLILNANLDALSLTRFMRCTLSREDVRHTKPSPEPYLLACHRLELSPQDCIAIEDTEIGVESAHRAGLTTVAWPHAMSMRQDFSKANMVIQHLEDLPWSTLEVCGPGALQ